MSFPRDWYWAAEDGRVFSSARCTTVGVDDADYAAWCEEGRHPAGTILDVDEHGARLTALRTGTIWPRDDTGAQTSAALDEVLLAYGLSMGGPVRMAAGPMLVKVLRKVPNVDMTKVRMDDLSYIGSRDQVPETASSASRIATAAGTNVKAWFDAALAT